MPEKIQLPNGGFAYVPTDSEKLKDKRISDLEAENAELRDQTATNSMSLQEFMDFYFQNNPNLA